jgi:hypothetical protein
LVSGKDENGIPWRWTSLVIGWIAIGQFFVFLIMKGLWGLPARLYQILEFRVRKTKITRFDTRTRFVLSHKSHSLPAKYGQSAL